MDLPDKNGVRKAKVADLVRTGDRSKIEQRTSIPGMLEMHEIEDVQRDAVELTLVPGIGTLTQNRIWASGSPISTIFTKDQHHLEAMGISPDACVALRSRRFKAMADEITDWSLKERCQILTRGSPHYPSLLKEIPDPPLVLYARGQLEALAEPCIAVVGTRKPTPYGLQMAEGIARDVAQRGIVVVSGLARGIDAAAHRGCLEGGGRTIAVFGCGIDVIYPRENQRLASQIVENGLLLSEFPPGTSPSPQNFPVRNRIISGLALGTLIVEASEYSGSLITARLAMEHNREVFGVPGNLTSRQSFGPNFLIKQGAKLVQSWRDIVEELPPDLRQHILAREDTEPVRQCQLEMLTEEESKVLDLIDTDRVTQFDLIYYKSGLEISRVSNLLLNLEMRGWVRQMPGNLYVKVARSLK